MRRATITIGDDTEDQLDSWMRQQDAPPPPTAVVQSALKELLALRGFATSPRTLCTRPSKKGSGARDVTIADDRYLAGR